MVHSPSVILLVWAGLLALGYTEATGVRVVLMLTLAVAFVAEERSKWISRGRRSRGADEPRPE